MRTATGIMLPLQREEFAQDAADQAGKLLTPEKLKSNVLPRGPACSAWRWTPAAEGERLRQDARRVHPRGREHARARVHVPAGLRDSSGARPVSPVPGVITAPLHVQHFTGEDASSPLLQVNRQAPVPLSNSTQFPSTCWRVPFGVCGIKYGCLLTSAGARQCA